MADLNNGTYWSETDASNNNASPNGWPEGMMPSGVNDSARADRGALKRFWDRINVVHNIGKSGGAVWPFTTANTSYPTAYVDGEIFTFRAVDASASGDQFQVNALPARPIYVIRNSVWSPIATGDITGSHFPMLAYAGDLNAGAGGFALLNPKSPIWNTGDGTATIGTSLAISGNLSVTGWISAGISLAIQGRTVLGADASNTTIYDATANPTLLLGTTSNLYRQTNHTFQNRDGSVNFLGITGSGTTVYGTLTTSGAATIGSTGITYSSYEGHSIAFGWNGTYLVAHVDGILEGNVLTSNNLLGNITVGGTLTAASGSFTTLAVTGGGTALNVSAGSINVGSNGTFGGALNGGTITATGGGTALNVPAGNAIIGGTLTVSGGGFNMPGGALNTGTIALTGGGSFGSNLSVGGTGITYTGLPLGHAIGFGWNGAAVTAYVDGSNQGNLLTNGGGTIVGSLTVNGPVTMTVGGTALNLSGGDLSVAGQAYKTGGGAWQSISDIRTKDADTVADYTTGLAALRQLRPISYQYNGRGGMPKDGRTFVGLVADDVLPVMPEMVGTMKEQLDPGDAEPTDILTLDATALTFALLNAVRELAAEIDTLKRASHAAD